MIESTGIKAEAGALSWPCKHPLPGEKWHARKHGGAKRRPWRKIHLGGDDPTLEIRAIGITGSSVGDAPTRRPCRCLRASDRGRARAEPPDGAGPARCSGAVAGIATSKQRLIHLSDSGSQDLPIACTEHPADADADPSIATLGTTCDIARAESAIGPFGAGIIKQPGPRKTMREVDRETMHPVDWPDAHRLARATGCIPPAEAKQQHPETAEPTAKLA